MPRAQVGRINRESSDVAKLVTLHHRRRGWAWVATGSLIGLGVYVGIDRNLFDSRTGPAGIISAIAVFVLLALVVAGLVVVIVDTARLHRADAAVRARAQGGVSHHPLYAHAYRYPPRHHGSWVFAIVMLVAMTGITAFILPPEVNSWAYVLGAENQDTFNPVSYGQVCSGMTRRGGCQAVTEGYLSRTGADVSWGVQVPLGQPFRVRDPLWDWGRGRGLIISDGTAIENIIAGLFFDGVTLLLAYAAVVIARGTSARRTKPGPSGVRGGRGRARYRRRASPAGR